jgi:hypothetical protein
MRGHGYKRGYRLATTFLPHLRKIVECTNPLRGMGVRGTVEVTSRSLRAG